MSDEPAGWMTMKDGTRRTIYRAEADAMIARIDQQQAERAAKMPDEKTALSVMHDAYVRLGELGWRCASYCPKDGSSFQVIEAGSTGIFRAHYQGEWPTGTWWLEDEGDLWPSRPILFRLYPEDQAKEDARWLAAREAYQAECQAAEQNGTQMP